MGGAENASCRIVPIVEHEPSSHDQETADRDVQDAQLERNAR
jgi:hypothetical protein